MNKDPTQPNFSTLYDQVSASSPWIDPWFPANKSSMVWPDVGEQWKTSDGQWDFEWFRIKDKYDSDKYSLFGSNGVSPADIFQGYVGNCWFMSTLSAIAEKPKRVEKMFLNPSNKIEDKGVYAVSMYALGVPHTVIVDDYLPMLKRGNGTYYNLFARAEGDKSVWASIIEKAFAKFNGNYMHLEDGWSIKATNSLQGGPWEEYRHFCEFTGTPITTVDELWSLLKTHDLNAEIIQTNTGNNGGHHMYTKARNGLVPHHAYTTLGVTEAVPGVKLVKVRNPWGFEGYSGPWCDKCDEWKGVPQEIKDKLSFTESLDGVFYMTVEDYHGAF